MTDTIASKNSTIGYMEEVEVKFQTMQMEKLE